MHGYPDSDNTSSLAAIVTAYPTFIIPLPDGEWCQPEVKVLLRIRQNVVVEQFLGKFLICPQLTKPEKFELCSARRYESTWRVAHLAFRPTWPASGSECHL